MNSPIKFRAWTKDHWINKGMVYDYQNTIYVDSCGWNEFPIMQFTGLKDVNGKEIYEGDIIKYAKLESYTQTVEWGEYSDDHSATCFGFSFNGDTENIIVIGNIYENIDLLKK